MAEESPDPRTYPLPMARILFTLAACGASLALERMSLPGLGGRVAELSLLKVGALGLKPVLGAFILVELVAAAVPALRSLRFSAEGRIRLRQVSFLLAVLLALVQVRGILRYLDSMHLLGGNSVLERGSTLNPSLVISVGLLFGVLAMIGLARLIDVTGIGVGYSVLIATQIGASLVGGLHPVLDDPEGSLLLRFLLPLGIFVVASWRMLASPPREGGRWRYRLPTCGLEPVNQAWALAALALNTDLARTFLWPLLPQGIDSSWATRGLHLLLTVALCHFFSAMFHRSAVAQDRSALVRASRASTAWLLALTLGSWIVERSLTSMFPAASIDAFSLVALIAVTMDVVRELRAGIQTGPQRLLRVVHRLDDADALSGALGAAGIATTLRGAHHRALYQFFAPFIPVGVLVPRAEAERAEVVAVEHERAMAEPPPLPAGPELPVPMHG